MQKKNKIIWKWILLAKVKLHLGGFYLKGTLIRGVKEKNKTSVSLWDFSFMALIHQFPMHVT